MLGPKTDNSIADGDGNTQIGHNTGTVISGITFDQFETHLEKRIAEKTADLARAHDAEKELLQRQIADLKSQLASPQEAYDEALKSIADLKARLGRMGNDIGGDRLAEAEVALAELDFSVADAIFAEVEERQQLEVQKAARAAFGRGEVAEAEVRWHDAAQHYQRAARLDPSCEALFKATHFTMLSGEYQKAQGVADDYLSAARLAGDKAELSRALDRKASVLKSLGRFAESESLFQEALEIHTATNGKSHPGYAARLNNLAGVVRAQGRYSEAESLYRKALEIGVATIGVSHPNYAKRLNNLALVLNAQGRFAEAERHCNEALEINAATNGTFHPSYAIHMLNLGDILVKTDRVSEGREILLQALAILEARLPEDHPHIQATKNRLAELPEG